MEAIDQGIANRLKYFEFRRIHHPNPTGESADPTSSAEEAPFTTVPHFHTRQPWQSSTTAAFEFLRQLPLIPPSTLPEDKRVCHICYERYVRLLPTEMPTILPCQHIFGRKCIAQWVIPPHGRPKNTCPMCRDELFDDKAFEEALASPIEESDSTEWISETRRWHPDAPHSNMRLEFLVRDLERIGRENILQTPTTIAAEIAGLHGVVNRYGGLVRAQERRIEEVVGREGFLEPMVRGDMAEVERLQGDLMVLQDMTRMMREVFPAVTRAVNGAGADGGVGTDGDGG